MTHLKNTPGTVVMTAATLTLGKQIRKVPACETFWKHLVDPLVRGSARVLLLTFLRMLIA